MADTNHTFHTYRIEKGGNGFVVLIDNKPWPEGFLSAEQARHALLDIQTKIAQHEQFVRRNRAIIEICGSQPPVSYEAVGCFAEEGGRWLKMDDVYEGDPGVITLYRRSPPQRECNSEDCDWSGYTDRMCGSIGPLCPDCGETTEPA